MSLTSSLLKIHDISAGEITLNHLKTAAARQVSVPENDRFGECGPWVYKVVEELHKLGMVKLVDVQELATEFNAFAAGNRSFTWRDRFPNLDISRWCS